MRPPYFRSHQTYRRIPPPMPTVHNPNRAMTSTRVTSYPTPQPRAYRHDPAPRPATEGPAPIPPWRLAEMVPYPHLPQPLPPTQSIPPPWRPSGPILLQSATGEIRMFYGQVIEPAAIRDPPNLQTPWAANEPLPWTRRPPPNAGATHGPNETHGGSRTAIRPPSAWAATAITRAAYSATRLVR